MNKNLYGNVILTLLFALLLFLAVAAITALDRHRFALEELSAAVKRLESRQLHVVLTDAAMNAVIDRGFDPVYGARPLKRYLQSKVETLIARKVIAADVSPGTVLTVDADENGEICIR